MEESSTTENHKGKTVAAAVATPAVVGPVALYTLNFNAHKQITIPKALRQALGVKGGDTEGLLAEVYPNGEVLLRRKPTLEEIFDDIDRIRERQYRENPAAREFAERHAGLTADEYRQAWMHSPEGKAYYKEKYNVEIE